MKSCFSRRARFLAYGLAGWAVDSLFVFAHTGRRRPSSLLNVPVYGLAELLFEPVHDRLRQRPLALRAALYGAGIVGVEYASGRLLRPPPRPRRSRRRARTWCWMSGRTPSIRRQSGPRSSRPCLPVRPRL